MEYINTEYTLAVDKLPDFIKSCTQCIHNRCPMCRKELEQCINNLPIQRIADQIPITCCYKINGCKACPTFKEYFEHKQKCEFKNAIRPLSYSNIVEGI